MGAIRTNAAAAMLGVSPQHAALVGAPVRLPRAAAHRRRAPPVRALRDRSLRWAFEETHNISSAIAVARERGAGPAATPRLRSAFARFDEREADRILEESLALRSVERTVEEVLLRGVQSLDPDGAEYGFAWRWTTGWLAAAMRVAPPATREDGVARLRRERAVRLRRPARPGARAVPAPPRAAHADADRGARPGRLAARCTPSRRARRAHGPRALARRARAPRLRRAAHRRGAVAIYDFRGALPRRGDDGAAPGRRSAGGVRAHRDALDRKGPAASRRRSSPWASATEPRGA
jgi:hypothetical protein